MRGQFYSSSTDIEYTSTSTRKRILLCICIHPDVVSYKLKITRLLKCISPSKYLTIFSGKTVYWQRIALGSPNAGPVLCLTSSTDALSGCILLLVRGRPKSACRVVVMGNVYNFYPKALLHKQILHCIYPLHSERAK